MCVEQEQSHVYPAAFIYLTCILFSVHNMPVTEVVIRWEIAREKISPAKFLTQFSDIMKIKIINTDEDKLEYSGYVS